jgi:serine/threonine protein kinase
MAISAGSRFGPYALVEPIGAGGMGEVWRATDSNLKRDVAIKVLPAAFVADADRLARFQREAEILASLNHPNIAQVHGLEKADDQTAIVMELVDGPTLADRIKQGPLPPDEAMAIGLQVVAALEAAHAKHIVHRDLKPANVKVKADGTVKVLDFGISKPIDPAAISGGSPVMTTPAVTQTGVILGTAAYMSPEQARGKFVDERTDVWAFGCLLFEMLTGQPAFGGEDVMLTLARVLDRDTDLSSIPKTISSAVRHTLKLCLEKDPKRRIADIRDVRLALEGTFETELPRSSETRAMRPLWRRAFAPAVAILVGAGLMTLSGLTLWPDAEPRPVRRFVHVLPDREGTPVFGNRFFDLSPDGQRFIYLTESGIYRRELDRVDAVLIPGTSALNTGVIGFGATSEEIYFGGDGTQRISIDGGVATSLIPADLQAELAALWTVFPSADGVLISHEGGVSRLGYESGSEIERLIEFGDSLIADGARFLPDGETLLLAIRETGAARNDSRIIAYSLTTHEQTDILPRGYYPRYLPSGHLLYVSDEVIRAIAFDPDALETRGRDEVVLSDVAFGSTGAPQYQVADDGTMAYFRLPPELAPLLSVANSGTGAGGNLLAWMSSEGRVEPFPVEMPAFPLFIRLSPDGESLAASLELDGAATDIYIYNLRRPGSPTRVTRDPAPEGRALWTHDGRELIYSIQGTDGGLFRRTANGLSPPERLTTRPAEYLDSVPYWISEDESTLIFDRGNQSRNGVFRLDFEDGTVEPLIDEPDVREFHPAVSPDARYIAYVSDESGILEVYVRPYPDVEADKIIVSIDGGQEPYWDPNGGFLYYVRSDNVNYAAASNPTGANLIRVPVQTEPELTIGDPELVSPVSLLGNAQVRPNYDYDPIEKRFLVRAVEAATGLDANAAQGIRFEVLITENWTEWLKQEVPVE